MRRKVAEHETLRYSAGMQNDSLASVMEALAEQVSLLREAVVELSRSATYSPPASEAGEQMPTGPPQAVLPPLRATENAQLYFDRVAAGREAGLEGRMLDVYGSLGGRGLYRDPEGNVLLKSWGVPFRRVVIRDASLEDPKEAASMGADLLKDMGLGEAPADF